MTEQFRRNQALQDALGAIGAITLRDWPEGEPLYRFSDDFTDDVRRIKLFARKRSVFGHTSRYINRKWDVLILIEFPYFLFYLPAILVAILDDPEGHNARTLLGWQVMGRAGHFAEEEWRAVAAVREFLLLPGVSRTATRAVTPVGEAGIHLIGLLATASLEITGRIERGRLQILGSGPERKLDIQLSRDLTIWSGLERLASFKQEDTKQRAEAAYEYLAEHFREGISY